MSYETYGYGLQTYATTVLFTSTNESTGVNSGAVRIAGGLSVNKAVNSNTMRLYATDLSTDINTGALIVNGGLGIGQNTHIGGNVSIHNASTGTTPSDNALYVAGGTYLGSDLKTFGDTILHSVTTNSISVTNGNINIMNGNFAVSGTATMGGGIVVSGSSIFKNTIYVSSNGTSTISGILNVTGGVNTASITSTSISCSSAGFDTISAATITSTSDLNILSNMTVSTNNSAHIYGGLDVIDGGINVTGNSIFNNALFVSSSGTSTISGGLNITGGLTVSDGFQVIGLITTDSISTSNITTNTLTVTSGLNVGNTTINGSSVTTGTLFLGTPSIKLNNVGNSISMTYSSNDYANTSLQFSTQIPTTSAIMGYMSEIHNLSKNPTGFNQDDLINIEMSGVSDGTTGTFSVYSSITTSPFNYYISGVKYVMPGTGSSFNFTNSDKAGLYYLYFDSDKVLKRTGVEFSDPYLNLDEFSQRAYVAMVYWDELTNTFVHIGDERHGTSMSPYTKRTIHFADGTVYESGINPSFELTDNNGSSVYGGYLTISAGAIIDEDLEVEIENKLITDDINGFYYTGAIEETSGSWNKTTSKGAYQLINNGGVTTIGYNTLSGNSYVISPVPENDYVLAHLIATNSIGTNRCSFIVGQQIYTTINDAKKGAISELETLFTGKLPTDDWLFVATFIYQSLPSSPNHCILVEVETGTQFIDWRNQKMAARSGSVVSHHALTGLSDGDDHPQYVRVDGIGRTTDAVVLSNPTNINLTSPVTTGIPLVVTGGAMFDNNVYVKGSEMIEGTETIGTIGTPGSLNVIGTGSELHVTDHVGIVGVITQTSGSTTLMNTTVGSLLSLDTSNSTNITTGSTIFNGGVGIAKNLNIGGILSSQSLNVVGDSDVYGIVTNHGATIMMGTTSMLNTLTVGTTSTSADIILNGNLYVSNTTSSHSLIATDITTGTLTVTSGFSLGSDLKILSTTDTTSITTGSIVTNGGIGIVKSAYVGGLTNIEGVDHSYPIGVNPNLNVNDATVYLPLYSDFTNYERTALSELTSGTFSVNGGLLPSNAVLGVPYSNVITSTGQLKGTVYLEFEQTGTATNFDYPLVSIVDTNNQTMSVELYVRSEIATPSLCFVKCRCIGNSGYQMFEDAISESFSVGSYHNIEYSFYYDPAAALSASWCRVAIDGRIISSTIYGRTDSLHPSTIGGTQSYLIKPNQINTPGLTRNLVIYSDIAHTNNYISHPTQDVYNVDTLESNYGALVVNGSVSINGNINLNEFLTSYVTDNSISVGTGAAIFNGGVGIAKNLNIGGMAHIYNTTSADTLTHGALIVDGGLNIGNLITNSTARILSNSDIRQTITFPDPIADPTIDATTSVTSITTGALIVDGGLLVKKNILIGGDEIIHTNEFGKTSNGIIRNYSGSSISGGQINLFSMNVNSPTTVDIMFSGCDDTTTSSGFDTCVCSTRYIITLINGTAFSLNGITGNQELYWSNNETGFNFTGDSFKISVSNGSLITFQFRNSSTTNKYLTINSVKYSIYEGLAHSITP